MKVCVIDTKECWRDEGGRWYSSGGFPLQMDGIAALFDEMSLVIVETPPQGGGLPLPEKAVVYPLRRPVGDDLRRKISVVANLRYYFGEIMKRCREADVVHVPPPGDFQVLGMLAALLLRKRLIVRYCGSWRVTGETTLVNRFTRGMMRLFAGGRNVMLATGGGERPPAKRVSWIFATALRAEEIARIKPDLERGLADPVRLIFAGRLSPEKGLDRLARVMGRLKEAGIRPRLTLCGDGPVRGELEAMVKRAGLEGQVRFMGQLNRADLSEAFQLADICVHPSLSEGYCKAWLDAMAHGVPVLTSEVGAARAAVGDVEERGWLVPPGDEAALEAALRRVISEERDWSALRRRCRKFVEAQTLEAWSREIGKRCAEQWGDVMAGGEPLPGPDYEPLLGKSSEARPRPRPRMKERECGGRLSA